ncbi:MAG: rRNA maturation RNase YbeY [Eubacterium sp.]|nr:rRNA maturation RNase YbeY [Eubacterium sp.]
MKISVEFDNRSEREVPQALLAAAQAYIEKTLLAEGVAVDTEISFSLVTPEEIHQLNRDFRDKDAATDVLSFPMLNFPEDEAQLVEAGPLPLMLGDIVISLDQAERQAEEYGNTLEREVCYLSVHSVLHLLGYDHMTDADKQVMRAREKVIMGDD